MFISLMLQNYSVVLLEVFRTKLFNYLKINQKVFLYGIIGLNWQGI